MDREANIDSIRALEEQIREHPTIKLKRARNSLLNISKLPPELLGRIFHWNVTPKSDFDGLDRGSHSFLLVCHHWFEVASRTPDLWSFWGNTPVDWARWCCRPGATPLDLILNDESDYYGDDSFDTTLRKALRDRATQDTIRRVHLMAGDSELLNSIIASLTSNCEELRSNRIESFILWNQSDMTVDVSDFFAHYSFPKLQRIDLTDCTISSWNYLTSRTPALTILVLDFGPPTPPPTTSQLLSILASNPALRKVELFGRAVPEDGGNGSPTRVQLPKLKELRLEGSLRHIFKLLHQLDHPRNMDNLSLILYDCDITDISQIIGPYLRDHLQRRDRPQNGLNIRVSSGDSDGYPEDGIDFMAGDAGGINFSTPDWGQINTFVRITAGLKGSPHKSVLERAALDLIPCAPPEEVVYFLTHNNPAVMEDTHTRFPNLKALSFNSISLRKAFPNPKLIGDGNVFPSLEHLSLVDVFLGDGDWSPLVALLACRVSSGNRLDTLVIDGSPHVCPEVVGCIRGMVRELKADDLSPRCPFGACRG